MSVTFETKVWEKDWRSVLRPDYLESVIGGCSYLFDHRVVYINNVENFREVGAAAERLVTLGIIDEFVFVEDHAMAALTAVGLDRGQLGKGYYYSIAELVGIHRTTTEYLLHFASDSRPATGVPATWLHEGVTLLSSNPMIKVFNLTWNHRYEEARAESMVETAEVFIGYGFSDQMYLIRPQEFRQPIYGYAHPSSARYPEYGGELFEKRVDAWMRTTGALRATYKHGSYLHENW